MRVTPDLDTLNTLVICDADTIQAVQDIAFGDSVFYTVWSDIRDYSSYHIYGARIDRQGNVLDPNGDLIGTSSNVWDWEPSITWTGNDFFVVWIGDNCLIGRFISQDGTPVSDTFLIVSSGSYASTDAAAGSGVIMTVWVEYNGGGWSVWGQILSPSGSPIGTPFWIGIGYPAKSLSVIFQNNRFLVVYTRGSSAEGIYGRFYDPSGQALGNEFQISHSANECFHCSVTAGLNDRYFSAWAQSDSSAADIYGSVDVVYGVNEDISRPDLPRQPRSYLISDFNQIKELQSTAVILFDASGRTVFRGFLKTLNGRLEDGVYFLISEDQTRYKIILISR